MEQKTSDLEPEFLRLFSKARKSHRRLGRAATTDDPDHKAAASFAETQDWVWVEALLEASRLNRTGGNDQALDLLAKIENAVPVWCQGWVNFLRGAAFHEKGDQDQAIKAYRKALDGPIYDSPGATWYNLGIALAATGDNDEAKKAYLKALDDPKYDCPGDAWNNLGNAFATKGELDEAIKAFRKALDDPKHNSRGPTWYNLGKALAAKGEHDEAIRAYRKALDDAQYDSPGKAWNNLGAVLIARGDIDEAIRAYRKALEYLEHDQLAKTWANLAQAYVDEGKTNQAEKAFKKALEYPDKQGSDHARAQFGLQLLKAKIQPEALSPDDRALAGKPSAGSNTEGIESAIITAIKAAGDTQYEKYLKKPNSTRDNTLSIVRGWSSAVTLLEGSKGRWRGGGYFLKWRGYGVVIDPGFDFLRNFHDAGYHGREINAVIVSHNHPDHNSDLKYIDDLRYEIWRRLEGTEAPLPPYVLIWDKDTDAATKFTIESPRHRCEPVPLTNATHHPIDLLKEHDEKLPLRIIPIRVQHETKGDVPHAMGMVIELLDKNGNAALKIGYTGDTAYFKSLHERLQNCDILIAHISQPSIEELQDAAAEPKKAHLGYRGTARLLKECNPKLALIGEFWAGFTDLRISLVKGLRQRSGVDAVLPAGLAMHVRLPSLEIECTQCMKPTAFSGIKVAPPTDTFGSLAYLCPDCMIG